MSAKLAKYRSRKFGLPPGSLMHLGEKKTERVKISVISYDEGNYEERELENLEDCLPLKDRPAVTWINIEGIHQTEVIEKLGRCFNLHPLLLEDILDTDQRPKMEDYEKYLFIVLRMIFIHNGKKREIVNEQVSLILGDNYVISLQEGKEGDAFDAVREQIRSARGRIRKSGADYLAYALIDAVVDSYFSILERLGEEIELQEVAVAASPSPKVLQAIHDLKRDMIYLRKSLWPLREVINALDRGESPLVNKSTAIYLKDVYDHVIQQIDTIETYRDMVTSMLDIYLSSISNRINEVMKVLTIIATIFIPLTFLAGVYGMNFQYFPEIHWRWGYALFWIVCGTTTLAMLLYFRRRKWI
jgi:magnesium transporter